MSVKIAGTSRHTTTTLSKSPLTEAASNSSNTTDSNGNRYEPFEEYEEIDRTKITDVFIIIIGEDF